LFAGSRLRIAPLLLILLAGSALDACRKKTTEPVTKPAAVKKRPEEIKRDAEAATKALEGLKTPMNDLTAKFMALHKVYDPLPPALPGFGETRAKFYSAAEGLGMMTAKIPWFSSRIDDAVKAQDGAELAAISKDIAHTYDELRVVDRISIELLHEIQPFKQKMDDVQASGKNACE
jgi:hypothetical protein